jgi:ubiquinol-cytochrome c reductase cytochrome c1 subunit
MSKRRIVLWAVTAIAGLTAVGIVAANPVHHAEVHTQSWSFNGFFGLFDQEQLKRGHVIYKDVCAGCHAMNLLAYRDLQDIGYTEDEVKAFAAEVQVEDGPNDAGEMFERPGRPSDRFKAPFPNEQAARAGNNGALPPDLSLMAKAREGGSDYIYGVLTGYGAAPAQMKMMPGMYYNTYFPGHQIAMPPPLNPDQVTFADRTPATVAQMAHDVSAFLMWAAEPNLEERHRTGFKVMLFLLVTTGVFYAVKRKIWSRIHH